ncbi:MAG: hypothetical protein HEQ38_04270 [Gemmatimonas sp.]|nr:hypothetical protein [Gemmatimonas sp.]
MPSAIGNVWWSSRKVPRAIPYHTEAAMLATFQYDANSNAAAAEIPVPDWHHAELDARLVDPAEQATISLQQLKDRLR